LLSVRDQERLSGQMRMRLFAKRVAFPAGTITITLLTFSPVINQPVSVEATTFGIVVAGEFFPVNEFDAAKGPKIRVLLDTGQTITLNQNAPFALKNGDRLRITVWKRRLLGYKTTYDPAP
jgi:hypothetical protein